MSVIVQRKLEHARRRMDEGDVAGTVSLCEEVLSQAPRNPEALWLLGMARLVNGDAQAALEPLEQAVASAPSHGMLLDGLGLAYLMLGRYEEAERVLRKAASAPGAPTIVHMRLGMALTNLGRHDEAAVELRHVLAVEPENLDARVNLGLTHARSGDVESAQLEFQQVLAQAPKHAYAMYNMGVLSLDGGDSSKAESWFRAALDAAPAYTDARINVGVALQRQGRLAEAVDVLRVAAAESPPQVAALNALGQVLAEQRDYVAARLHFAKAVDVDANSIAAREGLAVADLALGRFAEAAAHLREVVRIEPQNAGAWNALATSSFQLGDLEPAFAAAARATEIDPALADAYSTQAMVHFAQGRLDTAVQVLQKGHAQTAAPPLLGMLSHFLHRACDWPQWQQAWRQVAAKLPHAADLGSPFWLVFEDTTAEQQLDYSKRWATERFGRSPPNVQNGARNPGRLRVGYFSADLHEHPVARQVVEVFECHDRSHVELFAYSYGPDDGSALRARIKAAVEHFVDIAHETNERAIELLRADKLDVLVDLRGYTVGDRLEILAQRVAPAQATWFGYPGGLGTEFIDYLIADGFIVPPELEHAYAEKILRLPCYMPNDSKRPPGKALTRAEYGLPQEGIVFCSFNQSAKITPAVFGVWMNLLRRVEGSVLWLLQENDCATTNLRSAATEHGISADRIVFAKRTVAAADALARYVVADVALDTFPYGSHSTASDALWSACPLVALCGSTFASRVSGSFLTSCGIPELVAHNLPDYEEVAVRLATDDVFRANVRERLLRARASAPLFDTPYLVREIERLYFEIAA